MYNFFGILQLFTKYDLPLSEDLQNVEHSQDTKKRLQIHYMSPQAQNEFIDICGSIVQNHNIKECEEAKYFELIADKIKQGDEPKLVEQ